VGGNVRRKLDAALENQQTVWREHDANLARAWLAHASEDQVIVLPEFGADDDSGLSVISLD
jgi:hypothetical protein